jgi:hypothetical protein
MIAEMTYLNRVWYTLDNYKTIPSDKGFICFRRARDFNTTAKSAAFLQTMELIK